MVFPGGETPVQALARPDPVLPRTSGTQNRSLAHSLWCRGRSSPWAYMLIVNPRQDGVRGDKRSLLLITLVCSTAVTCRRSERQSFSPDGKVEGCTVEMHTEATGTTGSTSWSVLQTQKTRQMTGFP